MRKISKEEAIKLIGNRKYKWAQVHHTWKPSHKDFNGSNHLRLQQNMKNYHVNNRGWSDIGQHLTLFPDGTFVTGRDFNRTPAGIKGYNTGAFMIEMIGNFDKGHDKLEGKQLESALAVYQHLVNNGAEIMFHTEKAAKTCPGTGLDKAKFVQAVKDYKGKPIDVSTSGSSSNGSVSSKPKWTKVSGSWTGQSLKRGQYGKAVKDLQEMLASNYYYPNKGAKNNGIDSYYGSNTENAVKRYQLMHGLAQDGMAGKLTYASLKGQKTSSKPKKAWTGQTLNVGDRGSAVGELQQLLADHYFYPNKKAKNYGIDNIYGKNTKNAVSRFQTMNGLKVDGIAGRKTYNKLIG